MCCLFNLAAFQSQVAGSQNIENDEGLKLAAKLLQQAAGIFSYMKGTVMAALQQEPTPDLNPETLAALSALMLAEAQEIFVLKAINDQMKDAITAKLSAQCEEYYSEALKLMQREGVRSMWDRDWLPKITSKQSAYQAIAEYFQSRVCNVKKSVGEEIARLQVNCSTVCFRM
jgi:programmed cell death 6-interacting protein